MLPPGLHRICLSIAIGDVLPDSFRIFTAGEVVTKKGTFIFDDAAAEMVMAEYAEHGIDLMLDYGHASLASVSLDPASAGKAAGWFNLEMRAGELWAVNVRFTEPAAAALMRKEWRFMSPAFSTGANGRITHLANVALTNTPAARRLQPLMAASAMTLSGGTMDIETVKKAIAALKEQDGEAGLAILEAMVVSEAAGEDAPVEEEPAAEEAPVEEPALAAPVPAPEEVEKAAALVATSSSLVKLTGESDPLTQLATIEAWRTSHIELAAEKAKVAKERAALETSKRRSNALALIELKAETTFTSGLSTGKVCQRLLAEPLAEQNARIVALSAGRKAGPHVPADTDVNAASAADLVKCKARGIDPAKLAATKASIVRTSATKGV